MTRAEFIAELRGRLYTLPAEERDNAVQFYEEYFDDAGPENEQAVINELGSPENVANKILSGEGNITPAQSWKTPGRNTPKQSDTTGLKIAVAILAVISSPIWLTLLFLFAVAAFAAVIFAMAMLTALVAVALACLVVCVVCLVLGVWLLFRDPLNGAFVLSVGLMGLGGALVFFPLIALLWKKFSPTVMGWAKKAAGKLSSTCKKAWNGLKNFVANLSKS